MMKNSLNITGLERKLYILELYLEWLEPYIIYMINKKNYRQEKLQTRKIIDKKNIIYLLYRNIYNNENK